MKHVIGIDLGTSAVKILLVNENGEVIQEVSKAYPLIHEKAGYSEQDPQVWVDQTVAGLSDLLKNFNGDPKHIEGISFPDKCTALYYLMKNIMYYETQYYGMIHVQRISAGKFII